MSAAKGEFEGYAKRALEDIQRNLSYLHKDIESLGSDLKDSEKSIGKLRTDLIILKTKIRWSGVIFGLIGGFIASVISSVLAGIIILRWIKP
jgi:hypothetical protein